MEGNRQTFQMHSSQVVSALAITTYYSCCRRLPKALNSCSLMPIRRDLRSVWCLARSWILDLWALSSD